MSNRGGVTTGKRPHKSIEERVYEALGSEWGGNTNPPGDHLGFRLRDYGRTSDGRESYYVVKTSNDGFDLWMGTNDRWDTHMSAHEARRLAWFILWRWWARGTWFGLRRTAWYWLLRRRINRWKS